MTIGAMRGIKLNVGPSEDVSNDVWSVRAALHGRRCKASQTDAQKGQKSG